MFPLVAGESEIASARKAALFLLHGMIAEGKTPTPCSERKPQRKKTQIFTQITALEFGYRKRAAV